MSDDLTDARLEREIIKAQQDLDAAWKAGDRDAACQHVIRLTDLVSQRSDAQVERMERDKGLL